VRGDPQSEVMTGVKLGVNDEFGSVGIG
jgi:hypothetical protein